jgi:hypothetical protein
VDSSPGLPDDEVDSSPGLSDDEVDRLFQVWDPCVDVSAYVQTLELYIRNRDVSEPSVEQMDTLAAKVQSFLDKLDSDADRDGAYADVKSYLGKLLFVSEP